MKSLKLFFLLAIGILSIGAAAQNYEVKGVVIDASASPIAGAKIMTDKSKQSSYTDKNGIYSISVSPKDKKLSLSIINDRVNMIKSISKEIAHNPVNFEVDDTRPIKGHLSKDGNTYFLGQEDENWQEIIPNFGGLIMSPTNGLIYDNATKRFLRFSKICSPREVYSIKVIRPSDAGSFKYRYMSNNTQGIIEVVTIDEFHTQIDDYLSSRATDYKKDDTLRGIVTDTWGREVAGLKIRSSSGEEAVSDSAGRYALKITKKDKYIRCVLPYTNATTLRIKYANRNLPVNLEVMLYTNDIRGWKNPDDPYIYHPGGADTWDIIVPMYPAKYMGGKVMFNRYKMVSLSNAQPPLALIILDGVDLGEGMTLEDIDPYSIYSVKFIIDDAVALYGAKAQFGAVVLTSKANGVNRPVELADFDGEKAKRKGGVEGMKEYIALQGKNIEYHEDGYITIDGKRCGLYIINDDKFTHMRGIEVDMIDEIMIVRSGVEGSYGPRAKNGVVLISASQKEKKVVDEDGNTVSEKEYKKQQKSKKK